MNIGGCNRWIRTTTDTDHDEYGPSLRKKSKESEGQLSGWSPLLLGAVLEFWGLAMLLTIVWEYTLLGDTLPIGWQVVVGGVTVIAGILLVDRMQWGRPVGLLSIALLILGNVYFLFSFRTGASSIAIVLAAILGYVISDL